MNPFDSDIPRPELHIERDGAAGGLTRLAVAGEVAVVACGAAGALTWRRGR